MVGTINMDYRSLYLHFECGTLLYRCDAVMDLKMDAVQTIRKSHPVSLRECREGLLGGLLDAVLRLFAPPVLIPPGSVFGQMPLPRRTAGSLSDIQFHIAVFESILSSA